jgi:DNA-binding transcriptional LysR family regulator
MAKSAKSVQDWGSRIGRRLKLRDLHILSAVVRAGSMAKSAAHLGMSQPAVSEAIASLEDTLRVRLLDRSPRGVEPTIYARALLQRGDVVFDELKQGIRDIEFLADPTAGEIRIGCPESLMAGFVPAIIDRISRNYPKVSVHVIGGQPGEQEFRELRDRSVDLLLGRVFKPRAGEEVAVEVLCQDAFRVVVGSQSQWARHRNVALADLTDEPWILFPDSSVVATYIEKAFKANGLKLPRPSVTSFSMQCRLHLLESGRFVSILHDSVLRFNAKRWSVKALPIDLRIPPMPIVFFTLKNRTLSPIVQLFKEHAHEVAKMIAPGRVSRTARDRKPASEA